MSGVSAFLLVVPFAFNILYSINSSLFEFFFSILSLIQQSPQHPREDSTDLSRDRSSVRQSFTIRNEAIKFCFYDFKRIFVCIFFNFFLFLAFSLYMCVCVRSEVLFNLNLFTLKFNIW